MWYNVTQDHSTYHNLETPNKFSMSTLICPPQIYSYPGNPRQNWVTFNSLIDKINSHIDVFNTDVRTAHGEILGGEGSYKVVAGLQYMGCRKKRGRYVHAFNQWREKVPQQKLHLKPSGQAKALDKCITHFKLNTPNGPSQYYGNINAELPV